ncbi:MAG: glycine cleavage system aminomethyltransferase GcvT [Gammaproteobacteria bacterium]|nr:MAG: glycine cleavage system aminomethyltransferase GcvT [Gammaproteobacteria bacterium]
MKLRTPLYQVHLSARARMTGFAGWEMPLHYGSQMEEHHAVRRHAGLFDVSHMCITDLPAGHLPLLRRLLAFDPATLRPGRARYGVLLNPHGGVIDDVILYRPDEAGYRLISNAGTRERVLSWLEEQGAGAVFDHREDLALLALQGPRARELACSTLPRELPPQAMDLPPFGCCRRGEWFLSRTGYTGEDGFELALPAEDAAGVWQALVGAGFTPAGLAARDSLRLEAGLNLYGHEMDERTSPLEAGLAWTIDWEPADRQFIGRTALTRRLQEGIRLGRRGVLLEARGVLREGQLLFNNGVQRGRLTSGGFSPSLQRGIGLCRIELAALEEPEQDWAVEIRGKRLPVRLVEPPFVRRGRSCIEGLPVVGPEQMTRGDKK